VRAQQAQDLAAAHQTWVEADGDARRKQEELRDYNTERHANAAESLSQDTLANTKQWQAMQDATARRGQDITAADSKASRETTAKTSLANQRLSTGAGYLGNVLSVLSALNRDVAPGSSAVGDMLMPLLTVGKDYFGSLGGLDSPDAITGATQAPAPAAVDPTKPLEVPNTVPPVLAATAPDLGATQTPSRTTTDWFDAWQRRQEEDRKQQLAAAAMRNQGGYFPMMAEGGIVTQPTLAMVGEAGPEAVVPLNRPPSSNPMGVLTIIGEFLSKLGGVADSPGATPPPSPAPQPTVDPSAALASQAAAAGGLPPSAAANPMLPGSAHPGVLPAAAAQQARMNPIAPDGSPYATPQDIAARLQARRGGTPPLGGSPPSTSPAPGAA
jgi:hypothetical protein